MKRIILLMTMCLAVCGTAALANTPKCNEGAAQSIYPYPQEACLHDRARFPEKMSIRTAPGITIPEDIMDRYVQWLASNSVEVTPDAESAVLFNASDIRYENTFRQEGYELLLETGPDGKISRINISAVSEFGFLYALFSLQDISAADGIFTGSVTDFPRFSYRGVLEGGYSVWGHQQRLDVIKWLGRSKMNVFMYGPKEGYYYRRRWREPFSEEALDEFREYIEAAKKDRVNFIMAISPALSIEYSNPEEFKLLVAKFRQIQDLGVTDFAIFFDDVLPVLAYESDRKVYSHIAEAEADVTNRLLAALRERDPNVRLAFCPRQYWGWTPTKYIEIHREKLDPAIPIGWTGVDIVSNAIPTADAIKFAEAWGRPPAIGDNYSPFGPLLRRDPDLYTASDSFINNPYGFADDDEAQLSKFVNATIGDYAWNPEGYDPARSFTLGAARMAGSNEEQRALLFMLAVKGKQALSPDMAEISRAVNLFSKGGGTAAAILKALEKTGMTAGLPRGATMNPLLVEQLEPMYKEAEAGISQAVESLKILVENPEDENAFATVRKSLGLNGR